jgi:hypothetical protein
MTPTVKTAEPSETHTHPDWALPKSVQTNNYVSNDAGVGGWDPSVPPLLAPLAGWPRERESAVSLASRLARHRFRLPFLSVSPTSLLPTRPLLFAFGAFIPHVIPQHKHSHAVLWSVSSVQLVARECFPYRADSTMVSMAAFQAVDLGSIP